MEVLVDNKYYKKIRMDYGIILEVSKCRLGNNIYYQIENVKKQLKKIDENIYEVKEKLLPRWNNDTTIEVGTLVKKEHSCSYRVIEKVFPKNYWWYDLKISGGTLSGGKREIIQQLENIIKEL